MKDEVEIEEAYRLSEVMTERLDDEEYHMESIAPAILRVAFGWVLEKEDVDEDILEQLREDVKESEDGVEFQEE